MADDKFASRTKIVFILQTHIPYGLEDAFREL